MKARKTTTLKFHQKHPRNSCLLQQRTKEPPSSFQYSLQPSCDLQPDQCLSLPCISVMDNSLFPFTLEAQKTPISRRTASPPQTISCKKNYKTALFFHFSSWVCVCFLPCLAFLLYWWRMWVKSTTPFYLMEPLLQHLLKSISSNYPRATATDSHHWAPSPLPA